MVETKTSTPEAAEVRDLDSIEDVKLKEIESRAAATRAKMNLLLGDIISGEPSLRDSLNPKVLTSRLSANTEYRALKLDQQAIEKEKRDREKKLADYWNSRQPKTLFQKARAFAAMPFRWTGKMSRQVTGAVLSSGTKIKDFLTPSASKAKWGAAGFAAGIVMPPPIGVFAAPTLGIAGWAYGKYRSQQSNAESVNQSANPQS